MILIVLFQKFEEEGYINEKHHEPGKYMKVESLWKAVVVVVVVVFIFH